MKIICEATILYEKELTDSEIIKAKTLAREKIGTTDFYGNVIDEYMAFLGAVNELYGEEDNEFDLDYDPYELKEQNLVIEEVSACAIKEEEK